MIQIFLFCLIFLAVRSAHAVPIGQEITTKKILCYYVSDQLVLLLFSIMTFILRRAFVPWLFKDTRHMESESFDPLFIRRSLPPSSINASLCSHLMFGFAWINNQSELVLDVMNMSGYRSKNWLLRFIHIERIIDKYSIPFRPSGSGSYKTKKQESKTWDTSFDRW